MPLYNWFVSHSSRRRQFSVMIIEIELVLKPRSKLSQNTKSKNSKTSRGTCPHENPLDVSYAFTPPSFLKSRIRMMKAKLSRDLKKDLLSHFLPPYFSAEVDSATKGFLTKKFDIRKFLLCFYISLFKTI